MAHQQNASETSSVPVVRYAPAGNVNAEPLLTADGRLSITVEDIRKNQGWNKTGKTQCVAKFSGIVATVDGQDVRVSFNVMRVVPEGQRVSAAPETTKSPGRNVPSF